MQILASADLHGNLDIYEWLTGVSKIARPDVLVMAGDLLSGYGMPGTLEEAQRANSFDVLEIIGRFNLPVLY